MPPAKSLDADSPLAVWGAMLRHHREQAGWTQEQLGEMVHFSVAQISSLETARRNPTAETARSLDAALGLRGALAELLERLKAVAARQVLPAWFRSFVQVEEEAHTLRSWQPLLVPGGTTRGWISDSAEDVTAITRIHDALRADVLPQNQSLTAIEKARKTWI